MLYRVVMDVIKMDLQILVISDRVLPKPILPNFKISNVQFSSDVNSCQSFNFTHSIRKITIVRWKLNQEMYVVWNKAISKQFELLAALYFLDYLQ